MPNLLPFLVLAAVVLAFILALARRRTETATPDRTELLALQNEWRAPAELLASIPRPARFRLQAKFTMGVLLLFLAGGVFAEVFILRAVMFERERDQRLETEGVETEAQIVRKWEVHGKSTTRYVMYRFEVGNASYQRRARLSRGDYERLRPGDRVPVRYVGSAPEMSRLSFENSSSPLWVAALVPGLFLLLPFVVLWPVLNQKKLLEWGQPAPGMVTRLAPMKSGQKVSYQFLGMSGEVVSGSAVVPTSRVPGLRQTVTVVYDPQKPGRNTLYPSSAAEILPA